MKKFIKTTLEKYQEENFIVAFILCNIDLLMYNEQRDFFMLTSEGLQLPEFEKRFGQLLVKTDKTDKGENIIFVTIQE